ncbi:MAG TPA: HisA/HisF-related TIM barrel protein [Gemmatimonadaceae bacterium]|nr:HisA/HisF-related TIM barrel protein [Gemmatimonadaceae bacterium]
MRIIPVLDILGGRAVHARAGNRASYAPLTSQLVPSASGDAVTIARAFRERLGLRELYLADLDAITGRDAQRQLRGRIAAELPDVAIWVDAGVASAEGVRDVLADGAARAIVGLETLPAAADPRAVLARLAGEIEGQGSGSSGRAAFSLDLRAGQPNAPANPALGALAPRAIAQLAADAGFATIIILDLARVGMATGPDLDLLRELRSALPRIELVAGGGIRDATDLERLADAGADAALVGSALHHGSTGHGSILWACGVLTSDVTSPPAED